MFCFWQLRMGGTTNGPPRNFSPKPLQSHPEQRSTLYNFDLTYHKFHTLQFQSPININKYIFKIFFLFKINHISSLSPLRREYSDEMAYQRLKRPHILSDGTLREPVRSTLLNGRMKRTGFRHQSSLGLTWRMALLLFPSETDNFKGSLFKQIITHLSG